MLIYFMNQTDVVLKTGALEVFPSLLCHEKPNIVKEAAWTISNVAAGNSDQIQGLINANIIPPLLAVLDKVIAGAFELLNGV